MIKIDLITGFLGSGKTTFLKQYAKYLMAQGKNIGILENDFGAVNVDMLLLQELRGDQCELEMISGGCDKETHRRRFRTKLISMGMSGYDRILVEPSGIYDVDEFFDTLYDEPLNRWYEAGSVITILDAGLDEKLSEEEEYLLASEAANAGKIVLSKVQNVSEEKKEETIAHLNRTLEQAGCRRQFSDAEILQKNWDDLTEDDFKMLSECSYRSEDYRKLCEKKVLEVLAEEPVSVDGETFWTGHSREYIKCGIPSDKILSNQVVRCQMTGTKREDFVICEIID